MAQPPNDPHAQTRPVRRGDKRLRLLAVGLGLLPIVAIIVLRILITSYKVPSGAMVPTILIGDHLFARRGAAEPPPRGEVVVFQFPENREVDFIKRVIARPGDTLLVLDGRPILDGWPVPQCKVGPYSVEGRPLTLYVEHLGDRSYGVLYESEPLDRSCKTGADCGSGHVCEAGLCGATLQGPYRVPAGQVFVMGDNRDNTHDSRSWYRGVGGGVPFDHLRAHGGWVWLSAPGGGDRLGASIEGPPVLPPGAAALRPALEKCLRERPPIEKTTPP